jgi:hypothetical protein
MEAERHHDAQVAELETLNVLNSDIQAKLLSTWNDHHPTPFATEGLPSRHDDASMPNVTETTPKQSLLLPDQLHNLCTISNAPGFVAPGGNAGKPFPISGQRRAPGSSKFELLLCQTFLAVQTHVSAGGIV